MFTNGRVESSLRLIFLPGLMDCSLGFGYVSGTFHKASIWVTFNVVHTPSFCNRGGCTNALINSCRVPRITVAAIIYRYIFVSFETEDEESRT